LLVVVIRVQSQTGDIWDPNHGNYTAQRSQDDNGVYGKLAACIHNESMNDVDGQESEDPIYCCVESSTEVVEWALDLPGQTLRMVQVDGADVATLADGYTQEDEVEDDRNADTDDDDPAVESSVGNAEEEESHGEFEEALVEEVKCDAQDAKLFGDDDS
jgi:hypothetical protein